MKPLFLALLFAITLPATAFAPRWPAASLAWYTEAAEALTTIEEQADAAYSDPAARPDAQQAIDDAAETIAALDTPPALLPAFVELAYTARKCSQSLTYEAQKLVDPAIAVALRTECARSAKDTHLELARYAATVGGFPAAK